MDFGKSKSKFQEVPETGVKFADVAVREGFPICDTGATCSAPAPRWTGSPSPEARDSRRVHRVCRVWNAPQSAQGVDGAKLELQEVVDFLKNPDKYTALGANLGRGCVCRRIGPDAEPRCRRSPSR